MQIFNPILNPDAVQEKPAAFQIPEQVPGPVILQPIPVDQGQFTTLGFMSATLTLASAATIGANMVEVQHGTMDLKHAVANGLAKGVAASIILAVTPKENTAEIALTAAALAGAGYLIDKSMKKKPEQICGKPEAVNP